MGIKGQLNRGVCASVDLSKSTDSISMLLSLVLLWEAFQLCALFVCISYHVNIIYKNKKIR